MENRFFLDGATLPYLGAVKYAILKTLVDIEYEILGKARQYKTSDITFRCSQNELCALSGIGSDKTLAKHINELEKSKYITVTPSPNQREQKTYKVNVAAIERLNELAIAKKTEVIRKRGKKKSIYQETYDKTFDNIIGRYIVIQK